MRGDREVIVSPIDGIPKDRQMSLTTTALTICLLSSPPNHYTNCEVIMKREL